MRLMPSNDETTPFDLESMQAGMASVDRLPRERDQMLPALHAMHEALRWLPREAISYVASHVRIPLSEVYATTTAYSELRLDPPVPGQWHICTGVACDLAGAQDLLEAAPDAAGIDCQFLCALAPVAADEHERLFGRVSADELRERSGA
jgi:NADH:ubiquinone oxidoreductase subunit E